MKNIFTILGARPQFIKAAALSKEINTQYKHHINEEVIHTGQHFDKNMSENFFEELQIKQPSYHLNINKGSHGANTGRMIESIEEILIDKKPNAVIVYGDTNSTLAGALAASKLNIPIFHIEAGLRSFNRKQPEEQNRVLTDHLSELCFAPTNQAVLNLLNESINHQRIIKTGDIMADSARIFKEKANERNYLLKKFNIENQNYILLTLHRQENVDYKEILYAILNGLSNIKLPVIFPLHPRTREKINTFGLDFLLKNFIIAEPLGYIDMMFLEKNASLIVTDSGGIQKEAYFQKTPCITLRKETEWVELIEHGWNKLTSPSDSKEIENSINSELNNKLKRENINLYGEGFASKEILESIINKLN